MKKFKYIDLFAGIGGFRIALDHLGGECVFSSDIDKAAQKTYFLNFNDMPHGDIKAIDEKVIPKHDILTGGFPCQPFSIAGHRKGFEDTRGTLFFDIERIIRHHKPRAFILENVKGLVSHDNGRTLSVILDTLAKNVNGEPRIKGSKLPKNNLGYDVWYKVLNSKDFGVAQNRERIYIVGILNSKSSFSFPKTLTLKKTIKDILINNHSDTTLRVNSLVSSHILHNLDAKKDKFQLTKENPLLAYEVRPSKCSFRQDDVSPCLTAKMGTGGNNVPIYVQEMRKLSIEECLAIQGFPKGFKFPDKSMQSYKQIGNSVSVPVIQAVSKQLLSIL